MKKIGIAICIAAMVALAGTTYARNCNGFNENAPCAMNRGGMGANGPGMMQKIDPEKRKAFMEATKELRIALAGQRAEFEALMLHEKPDTKRARVLGEEMTRTRMAIKSKALEMGMPAFRGMGPKGKGCRGKGMRGGQGGMQNG